jgi:cytochrome c5
MNQFKQSKILVLTIFAAVVTIILFGGLISTHCYAEPPSDASSQTNSVTTQNAVVTKTQLTGAELYSIQCNRCHQERYPTERTGAQWKTIMLHMQVRANIPVSQARLILQYLQENSGR